MPLKTIFESDKQIPVAVRWTAPDADDGYIRFSVPLDIDGITDASVTLGGGAYIRVPDRHVTLELAILANDGIRRTRLARLDWKSDKGGHSNSRRCGGPWSGRRLPETHLHSFDLNWIAAQGRMRKGKLPCAEPIEQELATFEELRAFAGNYFRINNIEVVPRPEWVYDLFPDESQL
jgi:hypothetical protein